MPINYNRRYSYSAMVPERGRAMARLWLHPERIGIEGLNAAESRYLRAKGALKRFTPSLHEGTRAENIAYARKERMVLQREMFYATVERDAYALVLKQIEPDIPFIEMPPKRYRTPNGMRPAEVNIALAKMRYRLKGYVQSLKDVECALAQAIETRAGVRASVDQCAAETVLLKDRHAKLQADRRVTFGPNARAPKQHVAAIRESTQRWKDAYVEWTRAQAKVLKLRKAVERKRTVVAACEQRIDALIGAY